MFEDGGRVAKVYWGRPKVHEVHDPLRIANLLWEGSLTACPFFLILHNFVTFCLCLDDKVHRLARFAKSPCSNLLGQSTSMPMDWPPFLAHYKDFAGHFDVTIYSQHWYQQLRSWGAPIDLDWVMSQAWHQRPIMAVANGLHQIICGVNKQSQPPSMKAVFSCILHIVTEVGQPRVEVSLTKSLWRLWSKPPEPWGVWGWQVLGKLRPVVPCVPGCWQRRLFTKSKK